MSVLGVPLPDPLTLAFKSPWLLLTLLAVPAGIALYLLLDRDRARRAAGWSRPALLENMVVGAPGARRYVPAIIFAVAITLLLAGFARPEAKFRETKQGATIVFMIDDSGSMGANDVKPTRLLAADAAVTDFVKKLPSEYRVALVTFSSAISAKVPPTYDHAALLRGLPRTAQLQGTAMGTALQEAVTVAKRAVGPSRPGKPHPPATILLVSDGGNNDGQETPTAAATLARKAAIPVSTVAIGTAGGIVHQEIPMAHGKPVPFQQEVPVDPSTLKTIAAVSGGRFYAAHSAGDLAQVYKSLGSRLVHDKEYRELTVGVTAAALVLILLAAGLSTWWFRRAV